MHQVEGADVLQRIRAEAESNRIDWKERNIVAVELMGATGSGKTALLERLCPMFMEHGITPVGILGDVAGRDDELRLAATGISAMTIQTGKDCHLGPHGVFHAVDDMLARTASSHDTGKEGGQAQGRTLVLVENVGNLVCPADFPLGADKRIVVISVTEGDDMVRKHPLIFTVADAVVVNKVELAVHVGVSVDTLVNDLAALVPDTPVFLTDARKGTGLQELYTFLAEGFTTR